MATHIPSRLSRATQSWFSGTVLCPHAESYVGYLIRRGYAPATVTSYLRGVAHFAHWSAPRLTTLAGVDEDLVRCFVTEHLPNCRCAARCVRAQPEVRAALVHLLALLRTEGVIAAPLPRMPAAIASELDAFDHYLAEVRGLQAVTRQNCSKHVSAFLHAHFTDGAIDVAQWTPETIERFTMQHTARWQPASVKQLAIALRCYLRFKAAQGVDTAQLAAALPYVAQWRLSRLPRALSPVELAQLLAAFDRRTATGQRDYAIARCYVDLGLRTAEIARLRLDDVDWQQGRLQIRGKGRRIDGLPLPRLTGRAIVAYLRCGRGHSTSRALFLRHRPPREQAATTETIRAAMRNAARRCGLAGRLTGPHILRHTVAQRLLQGGASLKAIADVLRHRSLDTTTLYAKVDLAALKRVAAPWPGSRA